MAAHPTKLQRWATAAAATTQLVCYGLALAATIVFIVYEFAANLPAWFWASDPNADWNLFRIAVEFYWSELKPGTRLFGGWASSMYAFTYGPAMLATIATLVPAVVFSRRAREGAWDLQPMRAAAAVGRKVAHYASCPVWPHRFWLWWCNGLSVSDCVMWCGMLVMHVIAIVEWTKYYTDSWQGWDGIGLAYPIPKSVDRLRWVSLAFAWTLYIDLAMLFFPVAHLSFLHTILGSTWPALVKYHRWIGHFAMITLTGHALTYYYYWMCNPYDNFWAMFFDWNKHGYIVYFAGSLSWLFGLALWATSISWVRRNHFKVFYVTHIIGFLGFVVFGTIHYYGTIYFIAAGLVVYGLDVVYRVVQGQNVSQVSHVLMTPDGNLAQLDIPLDPILGRTMQAGQEVLLQFPTFNRWDWHPFTVFRVNVPADGTNALPSMTVVIKKYGRWTQRLMRALEQSMCTRVAVPVRMLGPVGGMHSLAHRGAARIVMFVGGIGASPAVALVHDLIAKSCTVPTTVVFTARSHHEFTILDEAVLKAAAATNSWLTIRLFHTGRGRCANCGACDGDAACAAKRVTSMDGTAAIEDRGSPSSPDAKHKLPPHHLKSALSSSLQRGASTGSDDASSADGKAAPRSSSWLSAYGWNTARPVQPRLLNEWQTLCALLVMWFGAVMGVVQAQAAGAEKWSAGVLTKYDYWEIGAMCITVVVVQAAGLPAAVVILPVHFYKFFKDKSKQLMHNVAMGSSPSCQVLGHDKVGLPEAGLSLGVEPGRPDVHDLLRQAMSSTAEGEVVVVAAGPNALCNDVDKAVWEINFSRRTGTGSRAYLHLTRETFEL